MEMEISSNERKGQSMDANVTNENMEEMPSKIAHIPVTEKVVFCIDKHLMRQQSNRLINMLRHFRRVKEAISVQPVEFYHIFFNKKDKDREMKPKIEQFDSERYENVFRGFSEEVEETQACDLGLIFQTLADNFQLPDASFYSEERPPPFVIHVVLIFGRNLFMPKVSDPNGVSFFAKNPFFTMDVLYLHDGSDDTKKLKIGEVLQVIAKRCSGYFHSWERTKFSDIQSIFNDFLGHPLIRYPQDTAVFKIDLREQEFV